MSKPTIKPKKDTSPIFLPLGEIEVMSFFQNVVNNTSLKNIGGDSWRISLLEITQTIDGKEVVNLELVKSKVSILKSQGFRPPSTSGKGGEKNFSPLMKETKNGINTLLGDNEFTGKDGNSYSFHSFTREYVFTSDGRKMLTTLKQGQQYTKGNDDREIMLKKDKNGKVVSFKMTVKFPDGTSTTRTISKQSDYKTLLDDYDKIEKEVKKKKTTKKK